MANKTINELPALGAEGEEKVIESSDELAMFNVSNQRTNKITVENILSVVSQSLINNKLQNKLTAGDGINIDNNTISTKLKTINKSNLYGEGDIAVITSSDTASTMKEGIVQLSDTLSTSTTSAATPNLVYQFVYPHSLTPDSSDFNDYISPGKFTVSTGEVLLNGPDDDIRAWILQVIPNTSKNYIQQFATAMAGIECYERYYDHGNWSSWVRFDNYQINQDLNKRVYYSINESTNHYNVIDSSVFDYHDSNNNNESIMGLHIASENPENSKDIEDRSLQWNNHLLRLWDNQANARIWEFDIKSAMLIGKEEGFPITSNENLNTYIIPGSYYCNGDAIAQTLSNCPSTNAFRMYVISSFGTGSNHFRQILLPYHNYYRWERRTTNGGSTWEDWRRTDGLMSYYSPNNNNTFTFTNLPCAGWVSSTSTSITFLVPFNVISGSVIVNQISLAVRGGASAQYFYARSGSTGGTYTQLGTGPVSVWNNNSTVRTNEVSSVNANVRAGSGVHIYMNFNYGLTKASGNTAVVDNNAPVGILASGTFTLS